MSTEKQELTPEQEAMIPKYVEEYMKIGFNTDRADRAAAEKAITEYYELEGMQAPTFYWVDSPMQGCRHAAFAVSPIGKYKDEYEVPIEEVREQASKAAHGSFDAYWVSFYDFISTEVLQEKERYVEIAKQIIKNVGTYWTLNDYVILSEKPTEIHLNSEDQLHNPNGLALKYADGWGVFAINGQRYNSMLEMKISLAASSQENQG